MRRLLVWVVRLAAFGMLFAFGMWAGLLTVAGTKLDDLEARASSRQEPGVVVARDNRTVLRRLRAPETRTYLEERDLPDVLVDSVTSAEDRRFFEHSGVDVRGLARAALVDLKARAAREGGSTITQQLVKNAYVGPDRSIARKSREAMLAVALETRWTKRRILTTYLNTAYFGGGRYGVVDAARGYFDVTVANLRIDQAALLAALLRSPEGTNPVSAPVEAKRARDSVLHSMRETGVITPAAERVAAARPIPSRTSLLRRARGQSREIAPQFTDAVVGDLIERYGVRRALGGAFHVRTTLDARLQRAGIAAVGEAADAGLDAALVAIDPATGEVRAMVNGGSAKHATFNVALDGHRQPGSAFKPFLLAAAYARGLGPRLQLDSAPFHGEIGGVRFPVTNSSGQYAGPTTLERATWHSDNTVYARLEQRIGIDPLVEMARTAGIRSDIDPVPAAVLGALPGGVTPTELAHAYATFAAHGERTAIIGGEPRMLVRVEGSSAGSPSSDAAEGSSTSADTWRPTAVRRQAIPREIADLVTDTLRGVVTQGTGAASRLADRPSAGKTGTTEDYRDAWFVGYTPSLVTAVWVGHADAGVPMRTENGGGPVTGGSIPARIWRTFVTEATAGRPVERFDLQLPRFTTALVDPATGELTDVWCAEAEPTQVLADRAPVATSTTCTERTRPLPDLTGRSEADARAILETGSFAAPAPAQHQLVTRATDVGLVIAQDPPAGSQVARDEPVTLIIGADVSAG